MLGLLLMLILLTLAFYVTVPLPVVVAAMTVAIVRATASGPFVRVDSVPTVTSAGDTARIGRTKDEGDAGGRAMPTAWSVPTPPDCGRRGFVTVLGVDSLTVAHNPGDVTVGKSTSNHGFGKTGSSSRQPPIRAGFDWAAAFSTL